MTGNSSSYHGSETLQPCPWCGVPLWVSSRPINPKAYCRTEECFGKKMPVVNLDVPTDVAAWNTRPLGAAQAEQEPAAWLGTYDGHLDTTIYRDTMERWKALGRKITPLYAAQPSPAADDLTVPLAVELAEVQARLSYMEGKYGVVDWGVAVASTPRATPIDHSDEECPNFPGCHCVEHCCDGWKHPSPELSSTQSGGAAK